MRAYQVWMVVLVVVLAAILPSLALGQEFYSPEPSATAGPSRFAGMPVVVMVQISGPYITYWGDFQSVARELLANDAGLAVVEGHCPNRAKVVVAQFDVRKVGGAAVRIKEVGVGTSGFKIATSGHIELWVGDEMVASVPFNGTDTARGLAISYGQGGLPATGYYGGQGYGGYMPAYGQGGLALPAATGYYGYGQGGVSVSLDVTGQAGCFLPNGQFVQPQGPQGGYAQSGYAAGMYVGGTATSLDATGQAGYFLPNGQFFQPGVGTYNGNYNYGGVAPQRGSIAIQSQQFPDAENCIRKALEPAIKKLAQGR